MSFCPRCGAKVDATDRYCQDCSSALARPLAAVGSTDAGRGAVESPREAPARPAGPDAPASPKCPACGTDNKAVAKFCRHCGSPLWTVQQDDDRTVIAPPSPPPATTLDETTIIQAAAARPDKWNVGGIVAPQAPLPQRKAGKEKPPGAPARSGRGAWIALSLAGLAALAAGIYFVWSTMGRDASVEAPAVSQHAPAPVATPTAPAPPAVAAAPPPAAATPPRNGAESVPATAQVGAAPTPSEPQQPAISQGSPPPLAASSSAVSGTAMSTDTPRPGDAQSSGRQAEERASSEHERAARKKAEREKAAAREKAEREKVAERERAAARAEVARREAAERQKSAAADREHQTEAAPDRPAAQPDPDTARLSRMRQELRACGEGFGALLCQERVRWKFCSGQWDKVPECQQGARN